MSNLRAAVVSTRESQTAGCVSHPFALAVPYPRHARDGGSADEGLARGEPTRLTAVRLVYQRKQRTH